MTPFDAQGSEDGGSLSGTRIGDRQEESKREVAGTNGEMLGKLLCNVEGVKVMSADTHDSVNAWQNVVKMAKSLDVDAVIDAGALLSGVPTTQVVQHILKEHPDWRGGAVASHGTKTGWVLSTAKGEAWPLRSSPIRERDALALFDQNQCRGADLKLRQTAVAALTVDLDMTKDVLMQAAGRLRQLGRGQKIWLVLSHAAGNSVQEAHGLSSHDDICTRHILEWVVANTATYIRTHTVSWGMQAAQYALGKERDGIELQNERLRVDQLYGDSHAPKQTKEVVKDFARRLLDNAGDTSPNASGALEDVLSEEDDSVWSRVLDRCRQLGTDITGSGGVDEECERELEREQEQEQERQVELQKRTAVTETPWGNPAGILRTSSALQLQSACQAEKVWELQGLLRQSGSAAVTTLAPLHSIEWNGGGFTVYCTSNFAKPAAPVATLPSVSAEDAMLEPPLAENMLVFPKRRELLLISQFEAEIVLKEYQRKGLWSSGLQSTHPGTGAAFRNDAPVLVRLSDLDLSDDEGERGGRPGATAMNVPAGGVCIPFATIAALRLFNGDTMFCDPRSKEPNATHEGLLGDLAQHILPTQQALKAALLLPKLRQLAHHIDGSSLQTLVFDNTNSE